MFILQGFGLLLFLISALATGQNNCSFPSAVVMKEGYNCCDIPDRIESDILEKCTSAPNKYCLIECVFNKTKLIQNDRINLENLKANLEKEIKSKPEFIPVAMEAMGECYPIAKQRLDGKNNLVNGCNMLPALLAECVYTKTFIKCPANRLKTGSACDEMKAFYTKCPMPSESVFN